MKKMQKKLISDAGSQIIKFDLTVGDYCKDLNFFNSL